MKITCESCNTRFHVADGQIPAQGARVRCSRCGHRFRVASSGEASASGAVSGAQHNPPPAPETGVTGSRGEEADLENPEFLFGDASVTMPGGDTLAGTDEQDDPADRDYLGDDPELGIGGRFERDPDAPAAVEGLGGEESVFGDAPGEAEGALGLDATEPSPFFASLDEAPPSLLATPRRAPASEAVSGQATASAAPEPVARFPIERLPSREREETPGPRPIDERRARFPLERAAAVALGLLLTVGSARALWLRSAPGLGPAAVEGAGWVASEVGALYLRDAAGRRVLVVRGALHAEQAAPVPTVTLALLDARGERLGTPAPAWLERFPDAVLDPHTLRSRLAQEPPPRLPSSGPPDGFTVLVAEPVPSAARFQLSLD